MTLLKPNDKILSFDVFPFSETIESATLFAAIICVRSRNSGPWRFFIPFLFVTVLVEVLGRIIAKQHLSNHWLYNIYLPVQVAFTGWFFYQVFPTRKAGFMFLLAGTFFLISTCIESYIRHFSVYNSYTDSLSSFLLIIFSGSYYYLLLKSETYTQLRIHAPFWFVTGVFLFNFGSMATVLFTDDIMNINLIGIMSLRYFIYLVLTTIIYVCWSYAFLCKYREKIS